MRLIPEDNGHPTRRFFRLPGAVRAAALLAHSHSGCAHVFYGVYPRAERSGRNEGVHQVQGLYADLDAEHFPGGTPEIDRRLAAFLPTPTLIVGSGGGRHAYWLFRVPVALDLENPGPNVIRREEVREALWAVAGALGVPPEKNTVHDLARVLRVPGSTNIKAKYERPLPCVVLDAQPGRYDPADFAEIVAGARMRRRFLPVVGEDVLFPDRSPWYGAEPNRLLAGLCLSDATVARIRYGAPKGQRNQADQSAITALLAAGAEPGRIRGIFTCPAFGIGAKYREKLDGQAVREADRYLAHSIGRAQAYLGGANPPRRGHCDPRCRSAERPVPGL